jgi:tryptophan synthase alpha chain
LSEGGLKIKVRNRLAERLKGKKSLVAYIMAGDPNLEKTAEYICALSREVDALELGVPFSDPIADGPVIQRAGQRALKGRPTTLADILSLLQEIQTDVPTILMSYYNLIYRYGVSKLARDASDVIDGIIVPDLPIEEASELREHCNNNNLCNIFLIAPTTSNDRMAQILESTSGFAYIVSRLGVTGGTTDYIQLRGLIRRVQSVESRYELFEVPKLVGFGVSKPLDVKNVISAGADGAIVGSALVREVENGISPDDLADIARSLKKATMSKLAEVET